MHEDMKIYKGQINKQVIFSIFASLIFLAGFSTYIDKTKPAMIPKDDRIRIAESFRIADQVGNEIWDGWGNVPFAILLVTPEYEFLIRHPNPSDDFSFLGYDSLLQSKIYFRKRIYETNLLAAFPAVSGISTVVIGQPENTASKTSTLWVVTLLHEHFHQLQNFQPDYYTKVNALNLAKGDKTGMWMLNYPFPYESEEVVKQFAQLTRSLFRALTASEEKQFQEEISHYYQERTQFQEMLAIDDYKYFSFQLWQEGVARYTEYSLAKLAGEKYEPSDEFKALEDFISFQDVAKSILENIVSKIPDISLNEYKRVAFYYVGSAEAMLLDKISPNWKEYYFKDKFFLEKYIEAGKQVDRTKK